MDDERLHEDIAQLEERIEAMRLDLVRCRKISVAAKTTIAAAALCLVLLLLGIIPFTPGTVVAALAAAIGAPVLLGSNATSWTQSEAALVAAEAKRADLIDRIALRVVGEEKPTLH